MSVITIQMNSSFAYSITNLLILSYMYCTKLFAAVVQGDQWNFSELAQALSKTLNVKSFNHFILLAVSRVICFVDFSSIIAT